MVSSFLRMDDRIGKGELAMKRSEELHETNRYRDDAFPVGLYVVTQKGIEPEGRGYRDLHWHEELQFTLVTDGNMVMQVNGDDYPLKEGQMIFINRNLLHMTKDLSGNGRYVSINFPDKLLAFFPGSRMEQDFVTPYTGNITFPAFVYSPEIPWQREGLAYVREITAMLSENEKQASGSASFRAYRIAMKCTELWYSLIRNSYESIGTPSKTDVRKQQRIRDMLAFVHANYMAQITLADVAAAASVSEGECCRCFAKMVRKSPMQYLMWYRITKGQELLRVSDLSVTEIAYACGFGDSSHFIQYFRRQTGVTPKEYRRRMET